MCFASELNVFGEDLNSIISCGTGVTDGPGRSQSCLGKDSNKSTGEEQQVPSESSSSRSHRRQSQHFSCYLYFDMYHVLFLFLCAQLADASGNVSITHLGS